MVHNAAPADVARNRRTVERILERARVVLLFQETNAPRGFIAGAAETSCFHVVNPSDLGLGEDARAGEVAASVAMLVRLGVRQPTAEAVVRATKRAKQ